MEVDIYDMVLIPKLFQADFWGKLYEGLGIFAQASESLKDAVASKPCGKQVWFPFNSPNDFI